jgi:hypothetical protein
MVRRGGSGAWRKGFATPTAAVCKGGTGVPNRYRETLMNAAHPIWLLASQSQSATLQALPPVIHILAGLGLVGGIVFWVLGRKLLRPGFAFLGAVAGGFVGFFLFPTLAPADVFGAPSPYVGLAAGGCLGLVAGIVLYRFAVAIVTGGALAMAGVLVAATALHFGPVQNAPSMVADGPAKAAEQAKTEQGEKAVQVLADQVTGFMKASAESVGKEWSEFPPHQRMIVSASAVAGGLFGFLAGLIFPRRAAAVSTALFGAAVWLPCGLWLVNAAEAPGREFLNKGGAIGWLVVWLTVSALGFAFQAGLGGKKKAAAE